MKKSIFNLILTLVLMVSSCGTGNYMAAYKEISYHQESFILYDFLNYYKQDFGEYPTKLGDLEKLFVNDSIDYSGINNSNLGSFISDPFSNDNYKYILINHNSLVLYSVGADGTDNNSMILENFNDLGIVDFNHYDSDSTT